MHCGETDVISGSWRFLLAGGVRENDDFATIRWDWEAVVEDNKMPVSASCSSLARDRDTLVTKKEAATNRFVVPLERRIVIWYTENETEKRRISWSGWRQQPSKWKLCKLRDIMRIERLSTLPHCSQLKKKRITNPWIHQAHCPFLHSCMRTVYCRSSNPFPMMDFHSHSTTVESTNRVIQMPPWSHSISPQTCQSMILLWIWRYVRFSEIYFVSGKNFSVMNPWEPSGVVRILLYLYIESPRLGSVVDLVRSFVHPFKFMNVVIPENQDESILSLHFNRRYVPTVGTYGIMMIYTNSHCILLFFRTDYHPPNNNGKGHPFP